MIRPSNNTQASLAKAIEKALEKHEIVELSGEYQITETLKLASSNGRGVMSLKLLGGGPTWEAIEPMHYMNWGGAAFDWLGGDGVITESSGIYGGFEGLSWFGDDDAKVIGVSIPYFVGFGTGQQTFDRCGFYLLDTGIRAGDEQNANCDQNRIRDCTFHRVKTCYQQTNWQGVDSIIETSSFAYIGTIFDVVRGGKFVLRWPTVCYTDTLFHVHATTYQLNTFILDGASIDAGANDGSDFPHFMVSDATELVRFSAQNVHITHPSLDRAMLTCTNPVGSIEAVLRSVHRIGKICDGPGEILVVFDSCTLMPYAIPFWAGGLTTGWARWKNGRWSHRHKLEGVG